MNKPEKKPLNKTQTTAKKAFDFLIGFLGSFITGNLGIVLIGQFDVTPDRIWISSFIWVWRLALAGLAFLFFTQKRIWLSIGFAAFLLLSIFGI